MLFFDQDSCGDLVTSYDVDADREQGHYWLPDLKGLVTSRPLVCGDIDDAMVAPAWLLPNRPLVCMVFYHHGN